MTPLEQLPVQNHQSWFQLLWASPTVLLLVKDVRAWIKAYFKKLFEPKERREDVMTRAEFEARHKEMKEDINFRFDDFSNKLDAHSAQARVDNRDLRMDLKQDINRVETKVETLGNSLFTKMDNFLAMLSMRGK